MTSIIRVVRYFFLCDYMWFTLCARHDSDVEQILLHRGIYRDFSFTSWREQYCRFLAGFLDYGQSWPCRVWCIVGGHGVSSLRVILIFADILPHFTVAIQL